MTNIERLVENWDGRCHVRVNVDKDNMEGYLQVRDELRQKFQGKKVTVYPGIVVASATGNPDLSCQFSREDEADFFIELYKTHGIVGGGSAYPNSKRFGCLATAKNAFVIGPEGEVYNCWHDMGVSEMVVGSIFDSANWNVDMLAKYMIGASAFDDPECTECFYLPVCDGGCANLRLRNKYRNGEFDTCVRFKNRLPEFLEIYYEQKQREGEREMTND